MCDHSFLGGFGQEFFSVSASVCDSRNLELSIKQLRLSAIFGGRLKRPSPCRVRSASGRDRVRGLSETSEKCAIFLYFGRHTPELLLDLGIYLQSLNEKSIHMGKHIFPSWHHFRIGFLFRPHHTFSWSHHEAFGLLCTSYD